jgi:hypothetical protein
MARELASRIGRPAGSLNIDAWLNGPPLTDADLRGKVILLDYWRMGTKGGNSRISSSQLRAWTDRYAGRVW